VNTLFWSTAGRSPYNASNEPFLAFLYAIGNTTNPPFVISISYADNENTVDYDYAVRVNTEFQKNGARGISIIAGSGDGGVSGAQSSPCKNFNPTFPAASPYITAVGGTQSSNPEVAASFSGGGFSNFWARPSYQTNFVENYFKVAKNLPNAARYNHTGAAFPDVATQSVNYVIKFQGSSIGVDGTSCATPTFAGIVTLLNDIRLQKGKSTLGYLNPLFYSNPSIFTDITSGNNPGCNTNGFYCAVGWDPLTGLGTPKFDAMSTLVASLP